MKRGLCSVLATIVCTSLFVGCQGNDEVDKNITEIKDNKVTLTVLTNRTDIVNTDLKAFSDKYTENNPNVKIEWQGITDYEGDTKVRLNSSDYGDVLLIPNSLPVSELLTYFEPLGKSTDSEIKDYKSNTNKAVYDEESGEYTVYGLTYGLGAEGIVYNKAAFKEAGIEELPKTLDELYEEAEKLKEVGIIPLATNFNDKWPLKEWFMYGWMLSGNQNYKNESYNEKDIFASDKPLGKSLDVLYEFVSNGWVEEDLATTNWEQSKVDLANGKIAMAILGTWAIPQVQSLAENSEDIGFMPVPTEDGTLYSVCSPDWALAVSNKSKHKDEAKDFLYAFLKSDCADVNGFIPAKEGIESNNTVIKEFLESRVTTLVEEPATVEQEGKFDLITNEGSIDIWGGTFVQDSALAAKRSKEEFEKEVDKLNNSWNKAQETLEIK